MNRNRHWTKVLAAVLTLVLLSGCASKKPEFVPVPSGIEVTDVLGRQVPVPKNSQRAACLYAFAGHVAVMLGAENRIVAIVDGLKRDILMQRKIANIANLPAPFNSGAVNIEELTRAKPDVAFIRLNTAQDPGEVKKLVDAKIPYVLIDYTNMAQQKMAILAMGQALGAEAKARAYLTYYDDTIAMVKNRLKDLPQDKKIRVYHSVNEATRTDEVGGISDEILNAAGLINVAAGSKLSVVEDKQYANIEQIYNYKPQAIIVNEASVTEYILKNNAWQGLKAVQDHEVYTLPVGISRWAHPGSIETPLAVLYLAKLFYPEKFDDIDIEKVTKDFYATYFDLDLTDDDIQSILSGQGMRLPKPDAAN